jgi:hypothetical protein
MIENDVIKAGPPVIAGAKVLAADNIGLSEKQMANVISQRDRE